MTLEELIQQPELWTQVNLSAHLAEQGLDFFLKLRRAVFDEYRFRSAPETGRQLLCHLHEAAARQTLWLGFIAECAAYLDLTQGHLTSDPLLLAQSVAGFKQASRFYRQADCKWGQAAAQVYLAQAEDVLFSASDQANQKAAFQKIERRLNRWEPYLAQHPHHDILLGNYYQIRQRLCAKQNNYTLSLKWGEKAVAIFRRLNVPPKLVVSLRNYASDLLFVGRAAQAEHVLQEIANLPEGARQSRQIQLTVTGIRAKNCVSNFNGALRLFEAGKPYKLTRHLDQLAYLNACWSYYYIGHLEDGETLLAELESAIKALPETHREMGRVLELRGHFLLRRQDLAAAAESFQRALGIYRKMNIPGLIADALNSLAGLYLRQQQPELAYAATQEAIAILANQIDPRLEAYIFQGQAALQFTDSVSGAALAAKAFRAGLRVLGKKPLPEYRYPLLHGLARAQAAAGHPRPVVRYLRQAVQAIEQASTNLQVYERHQVAFFDREERVAVYHDLAAWYLERNQLAQAFEVIERGKSRALNVLLAAIRDQIPVDSELTQKIRRLQQERDQRLLALHEAGPNNSLADRHLDANSTGILRELKPLEDELAQLRRQAMSASTRAGEEVSLFCPVIRSLAEFCACLPVGSVAVQFFPVATNWHALLIFPDGALRQVRLGSRAEAREAMDDWRSDIETTIDLARAGLIAAIETDQLAAGQADLGRLYDLLWRQLALHLAKADTVLVLPHGDLHHVPFHALHDGVRYVTDRWQIAHAPSASVYTHCAGRSRVFDPAAVLLTGSSQPDLDYVRAELTDLGKLFPQAARCLDDPQAAAKLQQHGPTATICHLAGHGYYEKAAPHLSYLRIGPDSCLTMGDLYGLRLDRAYIVTLSGCETGLTRQTHGDELIGLQRGFLYAGAARLVAGLWRVNDQATSLWMMLFYQTLLAGNTPLQALQAARKGVRDSGLPGFAHPVFWAGMQMIGVVD